MKKAKSKKCPICEGQLKKEKTNAGTWIICEDCNIIVDFIPKRRKNE